MDSDKAKDTKTIKTNQNKTNPSASDCAGEEREQQKEAEKKNKKEKGSETDTGESLIKLTPKEQKTRLEICKY